MAHERVGEGRPAISSYGNRVKGRTDSLLYVLRLEERAPTIVYTSMEPSSSTRAGLYINYQSIV